MKVAHFITSATYSPFLGDLVRHVDPSQIEVFVGSLAPVGDLQARLDARNARTFAVGCSDRSGYAGAIVRMARFLRRHRIDVVHTHLVDASLVGLTAARLARTPVRVMTRHHSDEMALLGSRRGLMADRLIGHRLADEVIACSIAVKRALMSIDRVPEAKISLVPYGFDWNRIQARPDARRRVREELGLGDDPVICVVSRLWRLKGHDVLIRAFAAAGAARRAWLVIAGSGPCEELRALARQQGVAERCRFLGHRSDVFDVMAAADIVAHPSYTEAQCQAIIEAMALGRPVVATSVGAAEEMIETGKTGWLVPPGDAEALSRSLKDALEDPARSSEIGRAGRVRIRALYPMERMLTGYDAIYRQRLAATGASS